MKIKVIDLLNKIANGEEIPRTIRWYDKFYNDYDEISNNYKAFVYGKLENNVWGLNEEIEILEEPKKIEKIDFGTLNTQKEKNRAMKDTINKLIDEINNLKEKD